MLKINKDTLLHVIGRLLLGVTGMYAVNILFRFLDYNMNIGINLVTMAILASLGAPGFLLIFGVAIYYTY